jgi:hypothetical protein
VWGDFPLVPGCDITGPMSQDHARNNAEMLSVLDWYRAAGVDMAVGEEPVDRFAQKPPAPAAIAARAAASQAAPVPQPSGPVGGDPSEARQLAASATNTTVAG